MSLRPRTSLTMGTSQIFELRRQELANDKDEDKKRRGQGLEERK
ncbi:hypothetical protein TIFTF001_028288 [Ficus carica]|uniref:Uncharacterized protein n=1 Tax=Ficus carica TaxID=3494 RepID=A0AA88DQ45_FICCA|nr:hypothetical protein TIFTF001_028288 [Ficus carica]